MRTIVAILSVAAAVFVTKAARADWPWGFVQVTCIPELSYFSIQRFTIYNIPKGGPYLTAGALPSNSINNRMHEHYGVYDNSQYLEKHPVTCTIPPVLHAWDSPKNYFGFTVKIVGRYNVSPEESDYSHMLDEVDILVDGKQVGTMGLNPYGLGLDQDLIQVNPNGIGTQLYKCSIVQSSGPADGKSNLAYAVTMLRTK